jgi:hypothetical protein
MKRLLRSLAEEYCLSFDEAHEIAMFRLDESTITGRGKNLWINEAGQEVLENMFPMDAMLRARVICSLPNPNYVRAKIAECADCIAVRIPIRMRGRLIDKTISVIAKLDNGERKYHWVKPNLDF